MNTDINKGDGWLVRYLRGYGNLTLFMIPVGVAINFVGGQIASLLKIPLYFDSIGTILIAALCGAIPGALVGTIANVLNGISNPTIIPYAVDSIGIGVTAGLLARGGMFRGFWRASIASVPIGLVAGIIGAYITFWLFGGFAGNGVSIVIGALHAAGMSVENATFVSEMSSNFVDKVISTIIVFVIVQRLSTRLLVKLPFGQLYIRRRAGPSIAIPEDDLSFKL